MSREEAQKVSDLIDRIEECDKELTVLNNMRITADLGGTFILKDVKLHGGDIEALIILRERKLDALKVELDQI